MSWPRTPAASRASTTGDQARIEAMARAIASRILHEPTLRLKRAAEEADAYQQVAALRELFGLDTGTEPEGAGAEVTQLHNRGERAGGEGSGADRSRE